MSCIQRTLRMRQLRSAIHTSGWRSYVAGLGGRRSASRVTGNSASSSSVRTGRDRILRAGFGTLVIGGTLGGAAYMYQQHPLHADHDEDSYGSVQQPPTPISTLLRSYIVYSLCSIPTLVDWSPTILGTLFSIPGVRQITEAIVRVTFFEQVRLLLFLGRAGYTDINDLSSSAGTQPQKHSLSSSSCEERTRVLSLRIALRLTKRKPLVSQVMIPSALPTHPSRDYPCTSALSKR